MLQNGTQSYIIHIILDNFFISSQFQSIYWGQGGHKSDLDSMDSVLLVDEIESMIRSARDFKEDPNDITSPFTPYKGPHARSICGI